MLLALQAATPAPAEGALGNIANQGILGSLLVLSLIAGAYMFRGWMKEKDGRSGDRVTDRKEFADVLQRNNDAMRELAIEALKSQEATKAALAGQEREFREYRMAAEKETATLRATISGLQQEQVRLVAALQATPHKR